MNFAVLSSSRGTTFQATIDALQRGDLIASCVGLLTDREDRGCIEKAEAAGLPVKIVTKLKDEEREDFDRRVDEGLRQLFTDAGADPIEGILAEMGWMWIHTSWFVREWQGRVLNVHPSLLPKYGGKGMYGHHVHEAVLANGEKESGMTIHLLSEDIDGGEILCQKSCSIEEGDTAESLQQKVQDLEKEWYWRVLQEIEN